MSKRGLISLFALAVLAVHGAYTAKIDLDRPDGIYKSGDTAVCTVLVCKDGKPLVGETVRVLQRWEGRIVRTEKFVADGRPVTISCKSDKPGWVYFGAEVLDGNGNPRKYVGVRRWRKPTIIGEIGALFSPDKILSRVREPADFDEFWAKRRAEVDAGDKPATLTEIDSGTAGIKLFAVTIPCPRGVTATGYLAYPEKAAPKSLPGYVAFQGLTYADANRASAVDRAKKGMLAFVTTWHGFPLGKPKKYYGKELRAYYQYGQKGLGDREKWVYTDIFFRVMSELRFLKERPEWDGRTLVVHGISLGGILSAFAAAIEPAVTTAVIGVPSFCECNAHEAGRTPYSVYRRGGIKRLQEHPELLEAGFYYDAVNFARRLKCRTFVCTGFVDESCYPSNVFAFYNAIPATTERSMTTDPRTGHIDTTKAPEVAARIEALIGTPSVGRRPDEAH